MSKKKQKSGAAKMKAAGRHAVMLGVPESQWLLLKRAAELTHRPLSQFVLHYALEAAEILCVAKDVSSAIGKPRPSGPRPANGHQLGTTRPSETL